MVLCKSPRAEIALASDDIFKAVIMTTVNSQGRYMDPLNSHILQVWGAVTMYSLSIRTPAVVNILPVGPYHKQQPF